MNIELSAIFDASALKQKFQHFQISTEMREEFYLLLASFVRDGIPVNEAVSAMDVEFKKCGDPRSLLTSQILLRLRGGGGGRAVFTIGQALSDLVPSMEAITIDAGESGGDLASGFERAAELSSNNAKILSVIKTAMIYPSILFAMVGVILWMMKVKFIPAMLSVAPVEVWPASARYLYWVSERTVFIYGAVIGLILFVTLSFKASRGAWTGAIRDQFDRRAFPWNMGRRISAASILASIASLMKMGVPLNDALDRMDRAASDWERDHFSRIRSRMKLGDREGEAISADLFDQDERWKIILYGNLVDFSSAMEKMARAIMLRVIKNVENTFNAIRNIMLVVVGVLILWVYGSFMSVTLAARAASQMSGV